jgi:hypothetical protein
MKNIHVLPTDKPSRLCFRNYFFINKDDIGTYSNVKFQNIYITSDEEIKDGDWWFDGTNVRNDFPSSFIKGIDKKIILTTDFDLIFNGVQAIDDEFLEWFVKNPSCERVETEPIFYASGYNLDIPKEEPLPYQLKGVLDTMSQEEFDKEWKKVTDLNLKSPLFIPKEIVEKKACTQNVVDEAMRIVSGEVRQPKCVRDGLVKQETLEEAAETISKTHSVYETGQDDFYQGFIEGAKWKEEKMFQLHDEWITYVVEHFDPEFSSISFIDYVKQVNNK